MNREKGQRFLLEFDWSWLQLKYAFMGKHSRAESLFYYFRLEDQVPENHLLRLIDRQLSFDFVRTKLKASYSDSGRPSIDPELLCACC